LRHRLATCRSLITELQGNYDKLQQKHSSNSATTSMAERAMKRDRSHQLILPALMAPSSTTTVTRGANTTRSPAVGSPSPTNGIKLLEMSPSPTDEKQMDPLASAAMAHSQPFLNRSPNSAKTTVTTSATTTNDTSAGSSVSSVYFKLALSTPASINLSSSSSGSSTARRAASNTNARPPTNNNGSSTARAPHRHMHLRSHTTASSTSSSSEVTSSSSTSSSSRRSRTAGATPSGFSLPTTVAPSLPSNAKAAAHVESVWSAAAQSHINTSSNNSSKNKHNEEHTNPVIVVNTNSGATAAPSSLPSPSTNQLHKALFGHVATHASVLPPPPSAAQITGKGSSPRTGFHALRKTSPRLPNSTLAINSNAPVVGLDAIPPVSPVAVAALDTLSAPLRESEEAEEYNAYQPQRAAATGSKLQEFVHVMHALPTSL
jgi:hypothetical protein